MSAGFDRTRPTAPAPTGLRGVALALAAGVALAPARAASAHESRDSLSVGVTADERDELWPVQISLELVGERSEAAPLSRRTLVVPGGGRLTFDNVVHTPQGQRRFELEVTPRQHPQRAVEIEWRLRVVESRYELGPRLSAWRAYALHRLGMGPRPRLGRAYLAAARADIVTTRGEPVEAAIRLGGETYHLRLAARTTGG